MSWNRYAEGVLLGVIAGSLARVDRTNLIGMGAAAAVPAGQE